MTYLCCPHCRLRFTPAAGAYLVTCPECDQPPQLIDGLDRMFGFRLVGPEDLPDELPHAVSVQVQVPDPGGARP